MPRIPSPEEILAAAERVRPYVHRTPVLTCRSLDAMAGCRLHFKCENLQKVGAFKFRGAVNAVFSLSGSEAARGVATHSSGNHAQAVALAARLRGVPAYIVMPEDSPKVKAAAVRGYGGRITFCGKAVKDRAEVLSGVLKETGAVFLHPSDDPAVIAGQASCCLELLEEVPDLDVVMAPVGGGGLASGTALACALRGGKARFVGAEPAAADDAFRSLRAGSIQPSLDPRTVADGLRTQLGENTFAILRSLDARIVTVSEEAIVSAMRTLWERMKLVVEPSAAVPLGALLSGAFRPDGARVGVILSGGNVDLDRLPWV